MLSSTCQVPSYPLVVLRKSASSPILAEGHFHNHAAAGGGVCVANLTLTLTCVASHGGTVAPPFVCANVRTRTCVSMAVTEFFLNVLLRILMLSKLVTVIILYV